MKKFEKLTQQDKAYYLCDLNMHIHGKEDRKNDREEDKD